MGRNIRWFTGGDQALENGPCTLILFAAESVARMAKQEAIALREEQKTGALFRCGSLGQQWMARNLSKFPPIKRHRIEPKDGATADGCRIPPR